MTTATKTTKKTTKASASAIEAADKSLDAPPVAETPKRRTPAQTMALVKQKARESTIRNKRIADQARGADGQVDRNLASAVLSPVTGQSITLKTPETGRDGLTLDGIKDTRTESIGVGLANAPERIDQVVELAGRSVVAEVVGGKRDNLVSRVCQRLSQVNLDGSQETLSVSYLARLIDKWNASNPDATDEEEAEYIASISTSGE